ncbi:MAG: surface lipoprotein assembly modifier [Gammaproteobacteria bacterium]|nr:surface lipoprotein assembly modifier [Gammaproteobacteria bacterium]
MVRLIKLLLLALCSNVYAAIDLNQLKSLFDTGQILQAYEYASKEALNYEGDPSFDYYYGIAAIDTGHASEGVFALNRVLALEPDNHAARLELARGYFILEEYLRAEQEFETVLGNNPPEDVANRIDAYLEAINAKKGRFSTTHSAFLELGFGNDSNANSGPDISSYDIGLITIPLDPASQAQEDDFSQLSLSYKVTTPTSPGTLYFLSLKADLHSNSEHTEFDTATFTFDTGFEFLHAQNSYTFDLIAQQFNLDGEDYRFLTGLHGSWRHNLTQQSSLHSFLQFAQLEFEGQEQRDADTLSLGTTYARKFNVAFSPVFVVGAYVSQDQAKQDSEIARQSTERDYYGMRLASILGLSENISAQLSINYQTSEYGLADTISGQIREDDYVSTVLNFDWRIARDWHLSAITNVTENTSNNTLFEYDRTLFSLNLQYQMK